MRIFYIQLSGMLEYPVNLRCNFFQITRKEYHNLIINKDNNKTEEEKEVEEMEAEVEFEFEVEEIQFKNRDAMIRDGSNFSQVRKMISRMTYLPMREISIQQVDRKKEQKEGGQNEIIILKMPTDQELVKNKDKLTVRLNSLGQKQLDIEALHDQRIIPIPFRIFQDDSLNNIRVKAWQEKKSHFKEPAMIQLIIQNKNIDVLVQEEEYKMTIWEFIQQHGIEPSETNAQGEPQIPTYTIQFKERMTDEFDILFQDSLSMKHSKLCKISKKIKNRQDIQKILHTFEEMIKTDMSCYGQLVPKTEYEPTFVEKLLHLYDAGAFSIKVDDGTPESQGGRKNLSEYLERNMELSARSTLIFTLNSQN